MKIVIAGSSGFIGKSLVSYFSDKGHQVIRLVREKNNQPNHSFWNPYEKKIDLSIFDGCDVVINLTGESIVGRWTSEKMRDIYNSRIVSAQFLAESLQKKPPKVFIQASAIGYYGDREEEILVEESHPGNDFLAKVCVDWEKAISPLSNFCRLVITRFGLVLSPEGGALKAMLTPFKMGMGGKFGSGEQYVSWIALEDVILGIDYIINNEEIEGPVNFASPFPVKNQEFTKFLGESLHRPTFFSMPEAVLKTIFGEGSQFFLSSAKVEPKKLLEHNYVFLLPEIKSTFERYF